MQQRESAKKAAASAAVVNAASPSRSHPVVQGVSSALLNLAGPSNGVQQSVVAQTASWLDRANAILKVTTEHHSAADNAESAGRPNAQTFDSLASHELESQMKEVRRLIHEGPLIQQTTAGLPHLINQGMVGHHQTYMSNLNENAEISSAAEYGFQESPGAEPADKRMRTATSTGAEDAEALVGFLRSVRASAASGQEI